MDSNPYRNPSSSKETTLRGAYGAFRNNGSLKVAIIALLIINAMLALFSSGILNYLNINHFENHQLWLIDTQSPINNLLGIIRCIYLAFGALTLIFLAVWINRSCKNGWLLDAPHMTTTPGLSVGYFFIPLLSLWKPFGTMKEIRRASFGSDHSIPRLLPLWWTFWILNNLLLLTSFGFYLIPSNEQSLLMARKLELISAPIILILNYLAIALVTSITLAQQRRAAQWKI